MTSPPTVKTLPVPFLLKARISFAPTHLTSQTARWIGTSFCKQWSSRILPRTPWGIDLLNVRNEVAGFERPFSHASFFASVRVTRGGSLNVFSDDILPRFPRCWSVVANKLDRSCSPALCLTLLHNEGLAVLDSFCETLGLSNTPFFVVTSFNVSSTCSPDHGKKSAVPTGH